MFTFAVRGSLQSVIGAAEDTVNFLNSTLGTIEQNIVGEAASAENAILSAIQGVGSVIGLGNLNLPKVEIPAASQLLNITIPDTVNQALTSLNNSIPTFAELKNATDNAISFPFDLLKVPSPTSRHTNFNQQDVKSVTKNFTVNSSLLNVPPLENLQFCSNNPQLDDFFQGLNDSVHHILVILAVITLLCALLVMVPYGVLEWWAWRKLHNKAKAAEEAVHSMEKVDFLEVVQTLESPISTKLAVKISAKINSQKKKILVRWFFAYITHPSAMLVLAISIAAFISCLFQTVLVDEIRRAAPVVETEIGNMQALITGKVQNASALWVENTNQQISGTESDINNQMLGWARESTLAVNNTLNTCISRI